MRFPRRIGPVGLFVAAGIVGSLWLAYPAVRAWHVTRMASQYAEVELPQIVRVVHEDDGVTFAFLDGHYRLVVETTPDGIRKLLATRPRWAKDDWKRGRRRVLWGGLEIPDDGNLMGIEGLEGTTVCYSVTVNTQRNLVYVEITYG